jgi:hypothetical protein
LKSAESSFRCVLESWSPGVQTPLGTGLGRLPGGSSCSGPAGAAAEGKAAATDAIAKAKARGLLPGSAFYNDIEPYSRTDTTCRTAVLKYLSAWTKELHARGYLSGVYMNLNLGAKDLSDVYNSTAYARPDALWIARYDGSSSLTGWANIANSMWAVHQRAKQYTNSHDETYGGVKINIDTTGWTRPLPPSRTRTR